MHGSLLIAYYSWPTDLWRLNIWWIMAYRGCIWLIQLPDKYHTMLCTCTPSYTAALVPWLPHLVGGGDTSRRAMSSLSTEMEVMTLGSWYIYSSRVWQHKAELCSHTIVMCCVIRWQSILIRRHCVIVWSRSLLLVITGPKCNCYHVNVLTVPPTVMIKYWGIC